MPTSTPTETPVPTTEPELPPAMPGNLQATVLSSSQIQLDWEDNSFNEAGFTIEDWNTHIAEVGADTTDYLVEWLSPNTIYCFWVQAFNSGGSSNWSDRACTTTFGDWWNDDLAYATFIEKPDTFSVTEDVTGASADPTDPVISCTNGQQFNTVWYRVEPDTSGMLSLNTFGSSYDTVLAVWEGEPGSWQEWACNDDSEQDTTSALDVAVTGGLTYYIEVAAFSDTSDDKTLVFSGGFGAWQ